MKSFNPSQKFLLPPEQIFNIYPQEKYQILFSNLDASLLDGLNPAGPGRPSISKSALLKTLLYKNLKALPTLYDLAVDLIDNPHLALQCGLICIAGFEMLYWGKFKDRGKIRLKYVCPITHSKKFAKNHPLCP